MYSDEWIKKEYRKVSTKALVKNVEFSEWVNESNTVIGISLSFNFESDVHFELLIEDWKRFLTDILKSEFESDLKEYFGCEAPYLKFADDLRQNEIKYNKIAFY